MFAQKTRPFYRLSRVGVVVFLLGIQFFLRAHNLLVQGAYVDEGYHVERAALVWRFDTNPGEYAQGKVLLYYWLGLFEGDRSTALYASRIAIVLFSLVTGATVYLLGRELHSHPTGLLALALYTVLPFTLFHERLSFADPFASGFACLVAWRSLVFGKHPGWRDGVWLGLTLALATLAKLTLVLLPIVPVMASLIYFPELTSSWRQKLAYWLRHYLPPLVLAALILVLCWLPLLIPAYLSQRGPNPYSLISPVNVAGLNAVMPSELGYLAGIIGELSDYVGIGLWGVLIAMGVCFLVGRSNRSILKGAFLLLYWAAATLCASLVLAADTDIRYIVPFAAPFVLLLALGMTVLWRFPKATLSLRLVLACGTAAWLITFAIPFDVTALTTPAELPLSAPNAYTYISGAASADTDMLHAAAFIDHLSDAPSRVYADYVVCHVLYFYTREPVQCLAPIPVPDAIHNVVMTLPPSRSMYVVVSSFNALVQRTDETCIQHIARYTRPIAPPLDIWRLTRAPC